MLSFLTSKFSSIFSKLVRKGTLTESDIQAALDQVKEALLDADVPYKLVTQFCDEIAQEVTGQKVIKSLKPTEQLIKVVHEKLKAFLGAGQSAVQFQIPSTLLVMGLQGSGKTTTVAKLAYWIKKEAQSRNKTRRILVSSVDFYRPAAVDQLEIVAHQAEVDFYRASSTDPVKAAQEISAYAQKNSYEIVILDTAGRLHVDESMLDEQKQYTRDCGRNIPSWYLMP